MAAVNDLVKKIDNVPSIEQFDAEWNVASCSARIRRVLVSQESTVTIERWRGLTDYLEGVRGFGLYLVHYQIILELSDAGFSGAFGGWLAVLIAVSIALALHYLIEVPAIKVGSQPAGHSRSPIKCADHIQIG